MISRLVSTAFRVSQSVQGTWYPGWDLDQAAAQWLAEVAAHDKAVAKKASGKDKREAKESWKAKENRGRRKDGEGESNKIHTLKKLP